MTTRFWISWYGGDGDDPRPTTFPVPISWWCTGYREQAPTCTICAVVDATDEDAALARVREFWPEAELRFCEAREPGWTPNGGRFPRTATEAS